MRYYFAMIEQKQKDVYEASFFKYPNLKVYSTSRDDLIKRIKETIRERLRKEPAENIIGMGYSSLIANCEEDKELGVLVGKQDKNLIGVAVK